MINQIIDQWEEKNEVEASLTMKFIISESSMRYAHDNIDNIFTADINNSKTSDTLKTGDFILINNFYCAFIGYSRIDKFAIVKFLKKLTKF